MSKQMRDQLETETSTTASQNLPFADTKKDVNTAREKYRKEVRVHAHAIFIALILTIFFIESLRAML